MGSGREQAVEVEGERREMRGGSAGKEDIGSFLND